MAKISCNKYHEPLSGHVAITTQHKRCGGRCFRYLWI